MFNELAERYIEKIKNLGPENLYEMKSCFEEMKIDFKDIARITGPSEILHQMDEWVSLHELKRGKKLTALQKEDFYRLKNGILTRLDLLIE